LLGWFFLGLDWFGFSGFGCVVADIWCKSILRVIRVIVSFVKRKQNRFFCAIWLGKPTYELWLVCIDCEFFRKNICFFMFI
jgi:hypothetical protein